MHSRISVVLGMGLVLTIWGCSRQPETPGREVNKVETFTTVLATIGEKEEPVPLVPGHDETASEDGRAYFQVVFGQSGGGVAYLASNDGRTYVVHNGVKGREYTSVGTVVLSSDGRRIAYAAKNQDKWHMVVDGNEGRPYDTLLTPIFSPDGLHLAYLAKEGDIWYVVVDGEPNTGTVASYTTPAFNAESNLIAYVEAAASNIDMRLIISDLTFDRQYVVKSIGDLLFSVSGNRRRIGAAQVVGDKARISDFDFAESEVIHEGPLYDLIEQLTLSSDGELVAYCALRGRERLIVLGDREEPLPEGRLRELPVVRPDNKGVGVLLISEGQFAFHEAFSKREETAKLYEEAEHLTYGKDGSYAYAARMGDHGFVVVNGKEGPKFDRVVTPMFSPDGRRVAYRARQDGQRFIVISDIEGRTRTQHPAYEQVHMPVFSADGRTIAYGVKDGNRLIWKEEGVD